MRATDLLSFTETVHKLSLADNYNYYWHVRMRFFFFLFVQEKSVLDIFSDFCITNILKYRINIIFIYYCSSWYIIVYRNSTYTFFVDVFLFFYVMAFLVCVVEVLCTPYSWNMYKRMHFGFPADPLGTLLNDNAFPDALHSLLPCGINTIAQWMLHLLSRCQKSHYISLKWFDVHWLTN